MPRQSAWLDEVDLSSDIDKLYLNGDKETLKRTLNEFKKNKGLKSFRLASSKNIDRVIEEISQLGDDEISPSLFNDYSDNLRKAVDQVFKRNNGNGLDDQLRANVSRFAAYKAMLATGEIREQIKAGDMTRAKMAARAHNRTQATEYNTTVSRCRTAKQFEQFNQSDNRRLFPNLRWLPSRSADPRELHMLFWNKVWSKDDDFWNHNTPGSLWNCKCDWEETDDPVTENPTGQNKSAKGLKGNPATTGEVFSKDHTYFTYMSRTREKKFESYIGNKFLRKSSIENLKDIQGNSIKLNINGESVDILFDSKTTSHISNDISLHCDFLGEQLVKGLKGKLKSSKLVAHEANTKLDKKPNAVHYYYYQFNIGNETYYFNIEENVVTKEDNRRFFRLYALTRTVRESAIWY